MTTTNQPKQRSEEWYASRKGRITASNVGAILGLSPFRTPDDVLRAMVRDYHGAPSEFTGNAATEYGTFHEAGALVEYQMCTGNTVQECGFYTHLGYDWLGASPDGLVGHDGLLEIKCPYSLRDSEAPAFKTAMEQPHYYAQMQIEMACAGRKWVDFFQWCPRLSVLERVPFNPTWFAENLPALKEFYERYLFAAAEPAEHLQPRRKIVESPDARLLLDEINDLGDLIERATARKKEVMDELVQLCGGVNSEVCGHKLTLVEKEGAVSYAKVVKDLLPDANLEPYRGKPSSFWKLS